MGPEEEFVTVIALKSVLMEWRPGRDKRETATDEQSMQLSFSLQGEENELVRNNAQKYLKIFIQVNITFNRSKFCLYSILAPRTTYTTDIFSIRNDLSGNFIS